MVSTEGLLAEVLFFQQFGEESQAEAWESATVTPSPCWKQQEVQCSLSIPVFVMVSHVDLKACTPET